MSHDLATGWSVYHGPVARHTDEVIRRYEEAGLWGRQSIFEVFDAAAADFGTKVALASGGRQRTYDALRTRVLGLARGLVARGIGPGDVVVAQLPNCAEFVELSLACARVGAYFCPVDPRIRSELHHILVSTRARIVVAPAEHRRFHYPAFIESLAVTPRPVIVTVGGGAAPHPTFDDLWSASGDLPAYPDPNGPWLVEFTSGTTAAPKGVIRTHNTSLATVRSITDWYGLARRGDDTAVLAAQPITFLFPYYLAVLMPLLNGLKSVILPSADAALMLDAVEEHHVTLCALVPSMAEPLLEEHRRRGAKPTPLKTIQLAGAVATVDRKRKLMEQLHCDVLDAYGLTESCWPIGNLPDSPLEQKLETVGMPCDTVEVRLLDAAGRPVADGDVGEVVLRGPAQFPGYFGNETATRAVIDDNGWFHTGDLAERNEAGYVRVVGRVKDVIVHGGVNVSPSEVEELLYTHPGVRAAAVVGVPDAAKGEAVWAAVELADPANPLTEQELREYLSSRLARFKVPARIQFVDRLPMSNVGKVQRRLLRDLLIESA
jgi:acyl-CoA synthetase (AMP-forming)/AMP-acid ligase II